MPLGPVFRHEMLAAGRKRRFFIAAVLIGVLMLVLLAIGYLIVSEANRYQYNGDTTLRDGRLSIAGVAYLTSTFYAQFAWATMLGVIVITPAVAAGAIATERERRTIEYLFATDLSNSEIVIDKLLARLLVVAKLIVATLPVLAIFRLLGGVPGSLLLVHFAMLASTATLTASLALAVGVWCDRARDAVPRAIGAVFIWLIALPVGLFLSFAVGTYSPSPWADWLLSILDPLVVALGATNPIYMLATAAGVSGRTLGVDLNLTTIAWMIGSQLVAAAVLMLLCVLMVRRVHLNTAGKSVVRVKYSSRAPTSRSPYEHRPMLWKEMFAASVAKKGSRWSKRVGVTLLVMLIATPLLWTLCRELFYGWSSRPRAYVETAVMFSTICGSIVLLLMGARAAGLVSHERERETWLTLLTTPLSSRDILAAKTGGNFYAFLWPMIGVVLIPLAGILLSISAVLATTGVVLVLLSVGYAATSIGLAFSLRMKSSVKAVGAAVFTLLGVGGFYTILVSTFFALSGADEEAMAIFAFTPCVPFLLALPVIASVETMNSSMEACLIVSYGLGLAFYTFLGFTIGRGNASAFEEICGRGVGLWGAQPATPTAGRYPASGPLPPASETTSDLTTATTDSRPS